MRSLGYIMLHYGKDYLEYTLASMHDAVDKIVILYSHSPTHHPSTLECPDKPHELKAIASKFPKVKWVNIPPGVDSEAKHLRFAFSYAAGYDVLVRLDSDEVWEPTQIEDAIRRAWDLKYMYIGIDGFIHFWRSFSWCNIDGFRPHRLHNMRGQGVSPESIKSTIYHFGYAIKEDVMEYKWSCHGHHTEEKSGWRRKWKMWEPGCNCEHLHPVTDAYWHRAEWFDKTKLPDLLKKHPYYNLERI